MTTKAQIIADVTDSVLPPREQSVWNRNTVVAAASAALNRVGTLIKNLDDDLSFHHSKHHSIPEIETEAGWKTLTDYLDDLIAATSDSGAKKEPIIVDTAAAAVHIQRTPETIRRWKQRGLITPVGRDMKGRSLWDIDDIDACAKAHPARNGDVFLP